MSVANYHDKTVMIIDWFNERPDILFDLDFIENMQDKLIHGQGLTQNMKNALDNIIERWRIE